MPGKKYDKEIIAKIADKCGITESSVYKILDDSFDFSESTSARVKSLAAYYGLSAKPSEPREVKIGIAMPRRPSYFWSEAADGMRDCLKLREREDGISVRQVSEYYSFPLVESEVKEIFDVFRQNNCSAYILYPVDCGAFYEFTSALPERVPLIIFNDYLRENSGGVMSWRANTSYIGADSYDEGSKAAMIITQSLHLMKRVAILFSHDSVSATACRLRINGFCDSVSRVNPCISFCEITADVTGKTAAALFAVELERAYGSLAPDCIYVSSGVTNVACLAVEKLRTHFRAYANTVCVGHELSPSDKKYLQCGLQRGYVRQDIYAQGYSAMNEAVTSAVYGKEPVGSLFKSSVFIK